MTPMELTPATIVLGLIMVALIVMAVRRLVRRGTCDCHDHCDASKDAGGCASCGAADRLVADMERATKSH